MVIILFCPEMQCILVLKSTDTGSGIQIQPLLLPSPVPQFLHLKNGPNNGRGREMVKVRPLARKGACPRSPAALKLPHQYGLQTFKVEENWAYHHVPPRVGWWYCSYLQVRRERLREIGNWPYRTGRVQILRPALSLGFGIPFPQPSPSSR